MAGLVPVSENVRVGVVVKVGQTYVDVQFIDRVGETTRRVPKPHPYAGRGMGIFAGIEKDTIVLMASGPSEKWYIVGIIPDINFYFSTGSVPDIRYYENQYPELNEGDLYLVGKMGQNVAIPNYGNIKLDTGGSDKLSALELSYAMNSLFFRPDERYLFTEGGREIFGFIKRDLNLEEDSSVTNSLNFLDGEAYDSRLTVIGRSPADAAQKRTTPLIAANINRNPGLVEKREIIYEYGDNFNVQDFDTEVNATNNVINPDGSINISALRRNLSYRKNRRADILDLNLLNYNHLIETVKGTLVDIYGNILDLNRSTINVPTINNLPTTGFNANYLDYIYKYLRRSVKYHFEINSRKESPPQQGATTGYQPPPATFPPVITSSTDLNTLNGIQIDSRWSIDIDGEGLTKINIPASSNTGNIPVLGRFYNSRPNSTTDQNNIISLNSGAYRDPDGIDIRLSQFGAVDDNNSSAFAGPTLGNDDYNPDVNTGSPTVTVGTAFHDMMTIANSIFGGSADNGDLIIPGTTTPFATVLYNFIDDPLAGTFNESSNNAGGRSVSANLDGSVEMSIGADSADRKSLVMDLGGSFVSRIGRDVNGISMITQTDGDVIIEIGGNGIDNDPRFLPRASVLPNDPTTNRIGRLQINFNMGLDVNGNPNPPQRIIIDAYGITLDSRGSMLLHADGNIVIDSDATLLLNAEQIQEYGTYDAVTRDNIVNEQKVRRSGRS